MQEKISYVRKKDLFVRREGKKSLEIAKLIRSLDNKYEAMRQMTSGGKFLLNWQ